MPPVHLIEDMSKPSGERKASGGRRGGDSFWQFGISDVFVYSDRFGQVGMSDVFVYSDRSGQVLGDEGKFPI